MNRSEHIITQADPNVVDPATDPTLLAPAAPLWVERGGARSNGIASYLEVPFMHKRLILGCLLLGILAGWLAIVLCPRTYMSTSKLRIRVGHESVSLDPTATTSATLMLQKTQEEEIVSALEVLNSRQLAETVVDRLGPAAVLDGQLPPSPDSPTPAAPPGLLSKAQTFVGDAAFHALKFAGLKDDISDRELAVMTLQDSLDIRSPSKSTVIAIEALSETPEMAQTIADTVTQVFMEEHIRSAHTQGSFGFFEQQAAEVEAELNEMVAAQSQFMQKRKIVSIEASRELLTQQLGGIDRDLVMASGELNQAISEVQDLKTQIAASDDEIVASKSDSTWSGMRQRIYELELAEQNLAANRTANHPELKQIRGQLAGARKILAQLKSEQVDENTTPNPAKLRMEEDLQRQQTKIVGLRSMIEKKQQQRGELERQVDALLDNARHLAQTKRDIQLAETSLLMLREKREEARVIEQLRTDKISNVHVFQPASFVERAVSPKKNVLAAGFLVLGLATGLGLSLVREVTTSSLRTQEDIENHLGFPVVANIPRIAHIDSPRLKEANRYRQQCQTLVAECLLNQHRRQRTRGQSLGIIGIDVGAGASTLAAHLAEVGSTDCRLKTMLVDADTRQRSVSKKFGLNGTPGLLELVSGTASHDECLQKAKNAPIDLIASAADGNEAEIQAGAADIAQALKAYQHDCDLLIVDLPAAGQPDQTISLAQHLDCVLVVVESEVTQLDGAERLLRRLSESNTEVIGIVLNKTRTYLPQWLRRVVVPQH
ncbi:GumC family protein [Roseimaritima ulvae]|uniref:Tyrosine-protein kinase ptk n=1 Tax=Roseimaritima ulvae TaxID=980254 RepID=A0A5B9QMB4_9BACT|nr:hypothetical protein [Roseimaritima ulvae]QEG38982.1 Tyrosine-protein kinase ptk [Roseimaritima ulvae]